VEKAYISTGIIYKAKPGADTLPLEPLAERPEFIARYVDGINFKKVGLDTSLSLFRKCIETAPPDFGYAHEWVGSIYQEMNQPDRALAFYEQAIARNDWCITSHGQLANLYMQQGRLDLAAEHLLKVVAYAPDYHEGYINLAAVYSQLKRFVDAEGVLLTAVEKWPAHLELKLRLAYTQMEAGKYDAAERVLDEVLRAYPTQRDARAILQEIGRRRARPADSIPATPPGP
jgi:tetratricopeptide (TPR) repeat protein